MHTYMQMKTEPNTWTEGLVRSSPFRRTETPKDGSVILMGTDKSRTDVADLVFVLILFGCKQIGSV